MKDSTYRKTLTAARIDLRRLYEQREQLERKIAQLRQTVTTLGALCSETDGRDFVKIYGLNGTMTDAALDAFIASEKPLSIRQIVRTLEDLGYPFKSGNRAASVHSVVRRLVQQGKLRPVVRPTAGDRYDVNAHGFWWGDKRPPEPWKVKNWGSFKIPGQGKEAAE